MEFDSIVELFRHVQCIRRKYPMIASYLKHLEKIAADEKLQSDEVDCFRKFLLKNRHELANRNMSEWYYYGTKTATPIFFKNVLSLGSAETIDGFWNRMATVNELLFPNGYPEEMKTTAAGGDGSGSSLATTAQSLLGGGELDSETAAAIAALESDPVFSDIIDNVKNLSTTMDGSDLSSLYESPDFKKLSSKIVSGIQSGRYRPSDITKTLNTVFSSVQGKLDDDTKDMLTTAIGMLSAAERGEQPDLMKMRGMLSNLKF